VGDALRQGRDSYAERAWKDAYESLSRADEASELAPEDVELLATAAYMLGRDDESMALLERAHRAYVDAGEPLRAVRCAFWVGMHLVTRGEVAPGTGWLSRAQRLLEREERDTVERGYMLMPAMFRHEAAGNYAAAAAVAAQAADYGQRFGDADLFALAVHGEGWMLIRDGRAEEGLGLLDEAMVAVTAGELSPIVAGIVYCGVILHCQEMYELRRAREWTAALTRWCAQQRDLVAFTGRCLVHRAEIMQLHGAWGDALEEARKAGVRLVEVMNQPAAGLAFYRQGELHRLQGEFAAAEGAYREASGFGWEPQPGLALLRLAQGRRDAAAAAIRRVTAETTDPLKRAGLLAAYVEIMLALDERADAQEACTELESIADGFESGMLGAMAAHARGAVELADGDAGAALPPLRRAWQAWQELEAPYEAARVRVLVAQACRALGDDDSAGMELEAARATFEELGAAPDLVGVARRPDTHGLTDRELEVLRLVAVGKSNREIASELVLSEHTVARHLQNIFTKLRVSSRTAATAFAFEHDLVVKTQ
jgi:DNA-binding CsgD family transcriptional regulator/tetratricopeptide (TPR) repeat protein